MQLENYFLGRKLIRSRPALFPFASYVFRFSFEFENAVVPVPTPLCTYARVSRILESPAYIFLLAFDFLYGAGLGRV